MKGWSPCKEQDSKVGWLCSNFTLQTLWQNGCCNKINLIIEELNKDSTSLILTNVKSRPCFNRVLQLSTNCLVFYFFLSLLIAAYCLLSKRNKPHMNSVKLPAFIKKKPTTCTFTELTSYHDYTNAERREIGFQETFTFGHCAYSQMQC